MKIIIKDVKPDDWIFAIRAAKWMTERPERKDAILAYGEGNGDDLVHLYAKRNKASVTIRPC